MTNQIDSTSQASDHPITRHLNTSQRLAVETVQGPALILAGAGSGKTRALTHRIAYLMSLGVPAFRILAVTFTNKAAKEMSDRIVVLLKQLSDNGSPHDTLPTMGTFHSICLRMLRRDSELIGRGKNFVVYDTDDQDKLMSETLKRLSIPPESLKSRAALSAISAMKSEAMSVRDARSQAQTHHTQQLAEVYALYQKNLHDANAMDFDDLLLEALRLLQERPEILDRYQELWQFIHVDEYQDTNHVQYLLISLLAQKYRNICVIGDPDQSIYAFRGADIRNILEFQREYADAALIKLERNYRSTQQILDAADAVISHNPHRPEKKMWTDRTNGTKVTLFTVSSERQEAEKAMTRVREMLRGGTPLSDHVILYRTNAQSRVLEEAALRAGIPYRILGGLKFYARKEVKDVLAYLLAIYNPSDTLSLLRIINVPARKIGLTTVARLQAYCNDRSMTLSQALRHIDMVEGLGAPVRERLSAFSGLLDEYREKSATLVVSALTEDLLKRVNMEAFLCDGTDEGLTRWENVKEMLSVMHKYDALEPHTSLAHFLEEVALISEVDKLSETSTDALTLMTLHLCKGLEFSSVIIVGCEEGIFPHSASFLDPSQLEEERRLLYVGMTRAKDSLALMHAESRMLWGSTQCNARSRFIDDIPPDLLDVHFDDVSSSYAWLGQSAHRRPSQHRTQTRVSLAVDQRGQQAFDDDMNQDQPAYENIQADVRVYHPSFGEGRVTARRGETVDIAFESGTKKSFSLSIAPLSVVE